MSQLAHLRAATSCLQLPGGGQPSARPQCPQRRLLGHPLGAALNRPSSARSRATSDPGTPRLHASSPPPPPCLYLLTPLAFHPPRFGPISSPIPCEISSPPPRVNQCTFPPITHTPCPLLSTYISLALIGLHAAPRAGPLAPARRGHLFFWRRPCAAFFSGPTPPELLCPAAAPAAHLPANLSLH